MYRNIKYMYEHKIRNVQVRSVVCTPLNIYINRPQVLRSLGYMSNRVMKFYKQMTLIYETIHKF
jgi:hypothetical protein